MTPVPPLSWFRKRFRRSKRRKKLKSRSHKSISIMRRTHRVMFARLIHDALLRLNRGRGSHHRAYNKTAIAHNIARHYVMKLGKKFMLRLHLTLKELVLERKLKAEGNFLTGTVYKPTPAFVRQYPRLRVIHGFAHRRHGMDLHGRKSSSSRSRSQGGKRHRSYLLVKGEKRFSARSRLSNPKLFSAHQKKKTRQRKSHRTKGRRRRKTPVRRLIGLLYRRRRGRKGKKKKRSKRRRKKRRKISKIWRHFIRSVSNKGKRRRKKKKEHARKDFKAEKTRGRTLGHSKTFQDRRSESQDESNILSFGSLSGVAENRSIDNVQHAVVR